MMKTIKLGSCVSIQGYFVRATSGGRILVEADGKTYEGMPVS